MGKKIFPKDIVGDVNLVVLSQSGCIFYFNNNKKCEILHQIYPTCICVPYIHNTHCTHTHMSLNI